MRRAALHVMSALFAVFALSACGKRSALDDPEYAAACNGEPLGSAEARQQALQNGYGINSRFDCIDKSSFEAMEAIRAAARSVPSPGPAKSVAPAGESLANARGGFMTAVAIAATNPDPLPTPPAELFVRSDYQSNLREPLAAFVTPDPGDGRRRPAIVWITGGDSSSLGDFWTEGDPANDQTASAFRKAGVVMMFPTLRGGHANPGRKEYFLGEVEDVIAAADHLATLPYVDAGSIYLGGHSTGGTLALLVAETSPRFQGVFAFGPVGRVDGYGDLIPVQFAALDPRELRLRSPEYWLAGIRSPTWIIEGENGQSNIDEFRHLCASGNAAVSCIRVPGKDHFSVIDAASRIIAARLAVSADGIAFKLRQEDFERGN